MKQVATVEDLEKALNLLVGQIAKGEQQILTWKQEALGIQGGIRALKGEYNVEVPEKKDEAPAPEPPTTESAPGATVTPIEQGKK